MTILPENITAIKSLRTGEISIEIQVTDCIDEKGSFFTVPFSIKKCGKCLGNQN